MSTTDGRLVSSSRMPHALHEDITYTTHDACMVQKERRSRKRKHYVPITHSSVHNMHCIHDRITHRRSSDSLKHIIDASEMPFSFSSPRQIGSTIQQHLPPNRPMPDSMRHLVQPTESRKLPALPSIRHDRQCKVVHRDTTLQHPRS
jgi:hypothetical protein